MKGIKFMRKLQKCSGGLLANQPILFAMPKATFCAQVSKDEQKSKDAAVQSKFVETNDGRRVDCGLLIYREPIFFNMPDEWFHWIKYKTPVQEKLELLPIIDVALTEINEADVIPKTIKKFEEMDLFEQKLFNEGKFFDKSSKNFQRTDPNENDPHCIQYASAYKTYLLLKNKENQQWEFPTVEMGLEDTFLSAKDKIHKFNFSKDLELFYPQNAPDLHVDREFTPSEKKDSRTQKLQGVRSFYFSAAHVTGAIELAGTKYDDYAWVPKKKMNKYLTREQFYNFIGSFTLE